jgi:hypothetical protein
MEDCRMPEAKFKQKFKRIFFQFLYSFILFGIGYIIAILISNKSNYKLQDVMSYEGFILILIGALLSPKSNHSIINLQGTGQRNANLISYQDLEVTRQEQELERESTNYYKNFFRYKVVKSVFRNLTFIFAGIITLIFSYYIL